MTELKLLKRYLKYFLTPETSELVNKKINGFDSLNQSTLI